MIKGVQVKEYRGKIIINLDNRQYSFQKNFVARVLKHHNFRRYLKNYEELEFVNPDSNRKKRGLISNFK